MSSTRKVEDYFYPLKKFKRTLFCNADTLMKAVMVAKTLMIQGTASDVGKSIVVTALCRILNDDGYRVTPFKAQNMALNSFVTPDGKEIGRAQAVQAEAARIDAQIEMNPILLKPTSDRVAQVIVNGKPLANLSAKAYYNRRKYMLKVVESALKKLVEDNDVVVIEGAGSPAEINLRDNDIVNMKVAELANAPVILVADIDRGGVFASVVGTIDLLTSEEKERIRGIIINKFRGDRRILEPGLRVLESKTKRRVMGVLPYIHDLDIGSEDSVCLEKEGLYPNGKAEVEIGVIKLSHISNFTDLDALKKERGVFVKYAKTPEELNDVDVVIIPGTKATIKEIKFLRETGLSDKVVELAEKGIPIIGICGGLQLLGGRISDPLGIETNVSEGIGLGLLPVDTEFHRGKRTSQSRAFICGHGSLLGPLDNEKITGYEIHVGKSFRKDGCRPFARLEGDGSFDGAVNDTGLVFGTYLHGIFDNDNFRERFINFLRERKGLSLNKVTPNLICKEAAYDRLAQTFRENVDISAIYALIKKSKGKV